jgi:carbon-monoxide dehydrogenase small subunit
MIMATKAFLDENPDPTEEEIKKALGGHLCRCTGYVQVIDAVSAAAKEMKSN